MITSNKKMNLDLNELFKLAQKPPVHSKGTKIFWQDSHIAKRVLDVHLDPYTEKASKKAETIEKEVTFIAEYLKLNDEQAVIDLGCGPGLYCEKFYNYSKNITGMDFSCNSISYAQDSAKDKNLNIKYIHNNYLDMQLQNCYDAAFVIYYDFGTLLKDEMHVLLDKINNALKPGGYFVFDILTPKYYESAEDKSNWYIEAGGFWNPAAHMVLENNFYYPEESASLYQILVVSETGNIDVYRIYQTFFTLPIIKSLLEQHSFIIKNVFNDLSGTTFDENSKTMGIFAQKVR